jgi:hypothetical protein
MVVAREFAEGFFDLVSTGISGDTERGIVVFELGGHGWRKVSGTNDAVTAILISGGRWRNIGSMSRKWRQDLPAVIRLNGKYRILTSHVL